MPTSVPEFATPLDRAKVEQLMQPALIRVIDNIRKQLDATSWQGNYEEELIWPAGTTPEQKQEYAALQKLLHGVPPKEHDRVAALMSQLPQPTPLYTLKLTKTDQADTSIDIWALCYKVCAVSYCPEDSPEDSPQDKEDIAPEKADKEKAEAAIEADSALFDEYGEVDWRLLDDKTKALVEDIFQALPE